MIWLKIILSGLLGLSVTAQKTSPTACSECEIITRDVVVIGGGSAGTYTALRLRDKGYSVAIIEPQDYLGGQAETYTTPSNWTIDIGVIVLANTTTVRNYFSRFDVPLVTLSGFHGKPFYNFRTGEYLTSVKESSEADIATGFANYARELAKYPELELSFNMTYPIPNDSDLLMPFGKFARKYNMSGAMYQIFSTNQGYAPLLEIPTLYMFKYLNADQLVSEANGYLTTRNHNIQELYQKIYNYFGTSNIYLSSTVLATERTASNSSRVLILTPSGRKVVVARKIVFAAPPTLPNLSSFTLTATETELFGQFFANGYYTGLIVNSSLPSQFAGQAASKDAYNWNIPPLPGLYTVFTNPGDTDYVQIYYGSPTVLPSSVVQADILASIVQLQKSLNIQPRTTPSFAAFKAHTPFNLMVTPDAIRNGFYEKLFALQGRNGTFWTGAAWLTQDSSLLWKFTDAYIVPKIVASLG